MKPYPTRGRSAWSSPPMRPPKPRCFDCCAPPAARARPRNNFRGHSGGSESSTWHAPALCGRRRNCPFKPTPARGIAARPDAGRLRTRPALHEVQFCKTSDDVRIAYACIGEGPPVAWAAHWLSHLSFNWESPVWRHWTEEFAKDHAFVHYDERGNGLSDWNNPEFSVDAFVRDLEAVVDALGLDRFALMGSSKGGPTAMAYAARHPERVSHLVLYGTFAQGWRITGDDDDAEAREAVIALVRQGWAQDNP